jgi:hypothetical protein
MIERGCETARTAGPPVSLAETLPHPATARRGHFANAALRRLVIGCRELFEIRANFR